MAKSKKIPMRKCLATHTSNPKSEMFRIVRTPEGEVVIDFKGKQNGRGAYLSKTKTAIKTAQEKKLIERQLKVDVPKEIFEQLLKLTNEEN